MTERAFRIAVDIGGTFTDCVVLDDGGRPVTIKALTTPADPRRGMETRGAAQALGRVRQKVTGLSEREKIHLTHLMKADPPMVEPEDIRGVNVRLYTELQDRHARAQPLRGRVDGARRSHSAPRPDLSTHDAGRRPPGPRRGACQTPPWTAASIPKSRSVSAGGPAGPRPAGRAERGAPDREFRCHSGNGAPFRTPPSG